MIAENPALTQEQFKVGGLVEPGVTHYATESFSYPEMAKKLGMKLSTLYGLNKKRTDILKQIEKYFTIKTKTGPKASGDPVTFTLKKGFKLDDVVKDVQSLIGRTPVHSTPEQQLFVSQEVSKANAGEKYVTADEILEKVHKKFKTKLKSQIRTYPVLSNLDTRSDKADQVLKNMLMDETPLNGFWNEVAAKRVGVNRLYFRRMLEQKQYNKKFPFAQNVPTYEALKDQGADFISGKGGTGIPKAGGAYDFIKKLSFSDQLAKALEIKEGVPVLKGITTRSSTPKHKTVQFAFRNWVQNKGEGDIKLFNKKGKPIPYEYGKVFDGQDISFKYKGKMFSLRDRLYKINNISDPTVLKKYFPEVERITNEMNNFGQKKIANPFKKPFVMDKVTYKQGDKIMAKDLVKKIQVDGYGYKPSYGTLAVLHGPDGVKSKPFTNLIMNTSDINLAETALYKSLKAKNISKTDYNNTIKNLREQFKGTTGPEYRQSIVDRLGTQVKEIEKYTGKGKALEIGKLLETAKTAKGPARLKALNAIVATVGTAAAASLFTKFGITPATADTGAVSSGVTGGDIALAGAAPLATKKGRKLYGKAAKAAFKSAGTIPGVLALEAGLGPGIVASMGGTFGEAIASPLLLEGTMRDKRIYNKLRDVGFGEDDIETVKDSLMLEADPFTSSMMPTSEAATNVEVKKAASEAYDWASEEMAKEDRARLDRANKFDYLQDTGFNKGGRVSYLDGGIVSLLKK